MKETALVTFALPAESGFFLRRLKNLRKLQGGALPQYAGELGESRVRVLHTGVGEASAGRILESVDPDGIGKLVSSGFAGGLMPDLVAGDLFLAENFSTFDVEIVDVRCGQLVTVDSPAATLGAKRELRALSGADAVDMETRAIADWAGKMLLPMASLRVISDAAQTELPVPFAAWFDATEQKANVPGLLGFLACHPGRIPAFVAFVLDTRKASRRLAEALVGVICVRPQNEQ